MTTATRSRVHRSVSNPLAIAPWRRACSMRARSAGDSLGSGPVGAPAGQGVPPAFLEAGVPDMGALARDAELVGDLGLGAALGEQLGRVQSSDLTPHQPSRQPNPRTSNKPAHRVS